jgi:hypothetical protein
MTKPVLSFFPLGRFCFGMFGVYQIPCCFGMLKDADGWVKSGHDELISSIAILPYRLKSLIFLRLTYFPT